MDALPEAGGGAKAWGFSHIPLTSWPFKALLTTILLLNLPLPWEDKAMSPSASVKRGPLYATAQGQCSAINQPKPLPTQVQPGN